MAVSYSSAQIAAMTPEQRSSAWFGADDASRTALHNANVVDLSPTHSYNKFTGEWTEDSISANFSNPTATLTGAFDKFNSLANANSAWSAAEAEKSRQFNAQQAALASGINAAEAAKNRDWQQMMSNTAHQREVADLRAAGLNPVLSAMNGNGAAVGSGATASAVAGSSSAQGQRDTSANSALVNLLASFVTAQEHLLATDMNAKNNAAIAARNNSTAELISVINSEASRYASDRNYETHRDFPSTDIGALASLFTDGSPLGEASKSFLDKVLPDRVKRELGLYGSFGSDSSRLGGFGSAKK